MEKYKTIEFTVADGMLTDDRTGECVPVIEPGPASSDGLPHETNPNEKGFV